MIWLQIGYPLIVGGWIVLSLVLNERAARQPQHYSLKLPVDDKIPFLPVFALPYFSAYVLGNAGYIVLLTHAVFPKVFLGYLLLFLAGLTSYYLFPCRVERQEVLAGDRFSTRLLARFQRRLKPYNSFPSMHVAYCLFSALMILAYGPPWLVAACLGWAGLVAVATLFTKQHYLLDVLAGAGLAMGVVWVLVLH